MTLSRTHLPLLPLVAMTAILLASGFGQGATAGNLIVFGPSSDYVTSDADYARQPVESGSGPFVDEAVFSDTQALSPSSGYSGPTFYGGYAFTSSAIDSGFTNPRVRDNYVNLSGDDTLWLQTFRADGWGTGTFSFASVYMFAQDDFEGPFSSGSVSLQELSVTYYQNSSGSPTDKFAPTGRWFVELADTYYLSQATITGPAGAANTVSITESELNATQWAVYDPTASLLFDENSASFSSLSLDGITAVGIYFGDDEFTGTANLNSSVVSFGVSEFSALGIPEPSTSASMAVAALLMAFSRRRFLTRTRR